MLSKYEVDLFDAVNEYVSACGGDPSKHIYGNTTRQGAVSLINRIIERIIVVEQRNIVRFISDETKRLSELHKDNGIVVKVQCTDFSVDDIMEAKRPLVEFRLMNDDRYCSAKEEAQEYKEAAESYEKVIWSGPAETPTSMKISTGRTLADTDGAWDAAGEVFGDKDEAVAPEDTDAGRRLREFAKKVNVEVARFNIRMARLSKDINEKICHAFSRRRK